MWTVVSTPYSNSNIPKLGRPLKGLQTTYVDCQMAHSVALSKPTRLLSDACSQQSQQRTTRTDTHASCSVLGEGRDSSPNHCTWGLQHCKVNNHQLKQLQLSAFGAL
jgi:hypothetical protein